MPSKKTSHRNWRQQTLSNFVNPKFKSVCLFTPDCDGDAEVVDIEESETITRKETHSAYTMNGCATLITIPMKFNSYMRLQSNRLYTFTIITKTCKTLSQVS